MTAPTFSLRQASIISRLQSRHSAEAHTFTFVDWYYKLEAADARLKSDTLAKMARKLVEEARPIPAGQ